VIDIGLSKMALIGAVALIVIGPEKLPRVARTVGTLLGKAQRYVNDVKSEVNRSMELDELRKMKDTVETAARDVHSSVQTHASDYQAGIDNAMMSLESDRSIVPPSTYVEPAVPQYRHPGKNWRIKRGAMPQWYKARAGVRTSAQSAAARVARHRPK
jgi:sec-independent protein translocase protein TatB